MTDARQEWISKRAYAIWDQEGRPHGRDAEHWEQAALERDEFERVALKADARPASAKKPLIEISKKDLTTKAETAKPKKKVDAAEKPFAAKAVSKAKSTTTNGKQA